ncbi:uncharacterized protein LOC119192908 isoform X2 [Manduca sexta]|uniref:uncharacterized protein LOC119192908 isoform X2 n=1 Tax=Manduca sexta TaxID=7130 RepID=UPI00189096EC|nr:uncharacterized protein LOC119192908 isoform X2 [Manduca sexta]
MMWFKKLFRGKCEKRTEDTAGSSKDEWINKFDYLNIFKEAEDGCSIATEALEVVQTEPREIYALTTIRNFRGDTLDEFVCESEWVLVTPDQFSEPRFQRHLTRTDTLTALCKTVADSNLNKKRAEIIAKSPNCHCHESKWHRKVKRPPQNMFQCFVNGVKKIFKCIVRKIKNCFIKKSRSKPKTCTRPNIFSDSTNNYLSAGRVRALRGGRSTRGAGAAIRAYALHLAQDKSTTFAQNIDNFIACTLDSKETCPQVMMRNMRQFMSGMKNYLVKHGEREFEKEVEKERLKLKPTEFLNLDAILEGVMHRVVVVPLRARLYARLAAWHARDVRRLHAALERAAHATPLQLGVKETTKVPSSAVLAVISKHFLKMQEADSPLDKLENLLAAISVMFNAIRGERSLGADDLLPVLAWTVARCRLVCAELEAELMVGLLPPALLAGEGGYYLTALFSAVAVLKRLVPEPGADTATPWRRGSSDQRACGRGRGRGRGARGAAGRVPRQHPPRARAVLPRRARARPVPRARARRAHHQPAGLRALRAARRTRNNVKRE